jgi:DNA-binding SARP family transcriptional activator
MLRVRVLGELELELDGEARSAPRGRRLRGLLGWLALHPGMHARAEVAGSLWPDVLDDSARTSLRTALAELRRTLGDGQLIATRDEVGLGPDVWVDVRAFEALARADRLDDALALVRGPLLEGLADDWVYAARDRQGDQIREVLARRADRLEAAGDLPAAVALTRELVAADRLAEDAHRALIRRLAAAGDRAAALAAYAHLRELLRRELGIEPSAPTRALAEEIRGAQPPAPVPPLPARLARRHRSPFVGRAAVLATLDRAFHDAAGAGRSGSRLVFLSGEAGIGKTRLAAELARTLHARGAAVLYGRADEDAIAPYQPFAEALRGYVAGRGPEELRMLAGPLATELGRLVPDLPEAPPAAATRDPAGERYRLFEAAANLLAGGAVERPLLLVLDDLHWADRPTLLLLRHLARADLGRVLILATCREGEPAPQLAQVVADLRRDTPLERLALGGLDEREVDALVAAWLGSDAPGALTEELWSETGGNPFFVEEVLRHVWESGEPGVPEGVREMLAGRLARLGEPARAVLPLAAVAGREIHPVLLAVAGGWERTEVVDALDAALAAHLIREEPGGYAFTHALVREAIYAQLSGARRALLHGQLAEALVRAGGDDAELAHHFLAAGDLRAADYSARAGRGALTRLAYEDAARHFERGLAAGGDDGDLLLGLGEALLRTGEIEPSRERFSAAAAAARERDDAERLARAALGRSGLTSTVLGHDPATVALLEEALAALGEREPALRARLLGRLAIELYHSPPVSRREELSAEAVALARQAGAPDALADALSARHVALWSPLHLDERAALADEMIAVAGDRERALQGRNWRVLDLLERGDIDAARREIAEHERLADELRLPGYQWWSPMWRAMLAFLEGRLADAERLRAEALEIGRRASDRVAELFNWIQAVFLDIEREPLPPATTTDLPDRVAVAAVQTAFRSDLPVIYAEMGRRDEARAELEAIGAGAFAGVASDMNWLASIAELGQGAALLGAAERAGELYGLLAPYRGRAVLVGRAALCLGPVDLHLGTLATALGRYEDAAGHLDAAAAWAGAVGARQWAVWTTVHRAELAIRRGEDGARLASEAAAEAERLGFGRAAARARTLAGP